MPRPALPAAPARLLARLAWLEPRSATSRLLAVAAAGAVVASVVAGTLPAPSVAVPESPPEPVSASLFTTIGTAHEPTAPITVAFDAPMDAAAVAEAFRIEPAAPHTLEWDAAGRVLTISPVDYWRPDTLYSVVISRTARSEDGGTLPAPLRTVVLTSPAASATLSATKAADARIRLDSTFSIRLDRELDVDAVRAAIRTRPVFRGDVVPGSTPGTYEYRPNGPLAPDTIHRLWLDGLVDADGVPFAATPVLTFTTVEAPAVVRFRPKDGARKVDRDAKLSVRFSQPMDEALTEEAVSVKANGKRVAGTASWAEDGTVLVFDPKKPLPYGARVAMKVNLVARSAAGAPIARAATASFKVQAKPASTAIPTGGGGAASGTWAAVEQYYLKLMNCTRTGGWVTSKGACSSPGGRDVAPLALSAGITTKVARPYAKLLATRGLCSHFIGGNPGDRLRRAGYSSYRWAENLGCRSGNAYGAVLGSHLFFQAEKPWNGGHYRNLMNAAFDRVGIGVWVSGGRVRLVVDFYRP